VTKEKSADNYCQRLLRGALEMFTRIVKRFEPSPGSREGDGCAQVVRLTLVVNVQNV